MLTFTIRAKSTGAARRAGLSLLPLGQWVQDHISRNAEGASRLLALVEDPKITVEFGEPKAEEAANWLDSFTWHAAPSAEDVRAMIEHFEAEAAEEDADDRALEAGVDTQADGTLIVNTQLPTAGPTLERDASEIDPQAKTTPNASDLGTAAEELTPPPPPVVHEIPSSTSATVLEGDPEPATTVVQEAAPASKTETKPAAKATPKPKH